VASVSIKRIDGCPLCRDERRSPVLPGPADEISVVRCARCGLAYADGRFDHGYLDVEHYGEIARARAKDTDPGGFLHARKRRFLALYDALLDGRVSRPEPGARALDIGCDVGTLLDELANLGWATEGIERSPAGAAARGRHVVHDVDIERADARVPGEFALVTMTHVLEHLDDPVAGLRFVGRHLAIGGGAVIEVPNFDDPARALWGRRFRPLELGDHVSFFDRATLELAIERADLTLRRAWCRPRGASSVMPSVLTAVDAIAGVVGRARSGVGGSRLAPQAAPTALRRTALAALDLLDPVLDRLSSSSSTRGANLVAIVTRSA